MGDSLAELSAFSSYVRVLGTDDRNIGEASVLAWAQVNRAIVLIDDQTAVDAARAQGVAVRRSLALISGGIEDDLLTRDAARTLVDDLITGGARLPCDGSRFIEWAEANGLLVATAT